MSKSTSAQRAARSSERKRVRNRAIKSAMKTQISKVDKFINANEVEPAQKAVLEASSLLDRAAKKKVIHPNTASRQKSRLTKNLNKAKLSAPGKAETTKTAKKTAKSKKG